MVLVELNKRDPHKFDMCRIDMLTGEITIAIENLGDVVDWLVNADFQVWGCTATNETDGSVLVRVRPSIENVDAATWRTIAI